MGEKFAACGNSFYYQYFQVNDFFRPIYSLIEAENALVDVFVFCETTNLGK